MSKDVNMAFQRSGLRDRMPGGEKSSAVSAIYFSHL